MVFKYLIKDEPNKKWIRDEEIYPKDVSSLLRNVFIHKLISVYDFKVFQILSKSGEYLYILIYADDACLKKEANRIGFNLEFEIGSIDLLSMEPKDDNLRPLRFVAHTKPPFVLDKELMLQPLYEVLFSVDDLSIKIVMTFRY